MDKYLELQLMLQEMEEKQGLIEGVKYITNYQMNKESYKED